MLLKEWDWDQQRFVEVEYPDAPLKEFLDWLRTSKQWYQSADPGRTVYDRFRRLQEALAAHKNQQALNARAAEQAGVEVESLLMRRQEQAAKMRAAKAAKRSA